jgi:hypothetical protein
MHAYDNNGVMHDCDIKELRANGWKPGVTDIIHEFDNNYGLDMYFKKQTFLAAMTLPRPEGITDEQFYNLVLEDSKVHSEKAKQFGIGVHNCFNGLAKGNIFSENFFNQEILSRAEKIYEWVKANKDNCIVDIKTTETKDGKFRQPYDSWILQLAGYKLGSFNFLKGEYIEKSFCYDALGIKFGGQIDYMFYNDPSLEVNLINLIVSSNEDVSIKPYIWKKHKIEWATKSFIKMADLYLTYKNL